MSNTPSVNSKSVTLSADTWKQVCTFLPVQDIAKSQGVCKRVKAGAERAFGHITSIDLETTSVSNIDGCVATIASKCTALKKLKLSTDHSNRSDTNAVTRNTIAILPLCKSLESLSFKKCFDLRDNDFTKTRDIRAVGDITQLKELEFVFCLRISHNAVARVLKTAPNLRTLGLVKCGVIMDGKTAPFEIDAIAPAAKNLTALDLSDISGDYNHIVNLVKQCQGLEQLNLTHSCFADTEYYSELQEANPNLKLLGIKPRVEEKKE